MEPILNRSETFTMHNRNYSRSWDNMKWWELEQFYTKGPSHVTSLPTANLADLRNGWLTLDDDTQARYQQKQMAEREQKIASLYEAQQARALDRVRHSPVASLPTPTSLPAKGPPGKVRQMFEERRTKAGIDKSYPLQPIHNRKTVTDGNQRSVTNGHSKPATNGHTKPLSNGHSKTAPVRAEKKPARVSNGISNGNVKKTVHKSENIMNAAGDLNHNHEPDLNHVKFPAYSKEAEDRIDGGGMIEDETFPESLAPEPTPRTPEHPQRPIRRNQAAKKSPVPSPPVAPPRRGATDNAVSSDKSREVMKRNTKPINKTQTQPTVQSSSKARSASSLVSGGGGGGASPAASGGGGAACSVCGRRFAPDRLAKHEAICKRTAAKKRKPFDALKHRLAGTEAEPFINKLRKGAVGARAPAAAAAATAKPLNSSWRAKHAEFIQAIRAAKQVQQHLAAGGKLSDLPPPPPSENPDYVQCPHCSRRFNQQAADRHIPKCANYQFNKPKPAARRR